MTAFVSVVIPTHNRARLVVKAIESCLRQHGCNGVGGDGMEVVVVDDHSTDATPAILEAYGDAIVVVRNAQNLERGASRNAGARVARGRWLAFLDSDDEWEDDKLAVQLRSIGAARASLTGAWLIDDEGRPLGLDNIAIGPQTEVDVRNPFRAVPSSLLIDRVLYDEIGGFPEDRKLQGSEDWLLMAKLVHHGVEPKVIPSPLVRYRVHDSNSTASPDTYVRSGLAAIDWLEDRALTSHQRARIARGLQYERGAWAHALSGNFGMAFRYLLLAVWLGADGPTTVAFRTALAALRSFRKRGSLPGRKGWVV